MASIKFGHRKGKKKKSLQTHQSPGCSLPEWIQPTSSSFYLFIYLLLFFLHSSPFCIHLVTGLLLFIFSPLEFSLILLALLSSFIIFKFQLFTFALSSVSHVIGLGNDKGKLKKKKSTISVRHSDLLTSFLLNKFLFLFFLLSRDNGTC